MTGFELGWLSWVIVGLVAGALAKLIMPGRQGGGFWATLVLGLVGAFLGGIVAGLVFGVGSLGFLNPVTWLFAIVGSVVVLAVWGMLRGRGHRDSPAH